MRILIVKTSAIGDVLQAFPVVQYLKKRFPDSCIDWIVEQPSAPLLRAHPLIDTVHEIDTKHLTLASLRRSIDALRSKRYDLLFDLQGNWKSGLITWLTKADAKVGWDRHGVQEIGGALFTDYKLKLSSYPSRRVQYMHCVQGYLGDTTPFEAPPMALLLSPEEERFSFPLPQELPVWMVCIGSRWKNKQMPLSSWKRYLEKETDPFYLFIYGTEQEKEEVTLLQQHFASRSVILPKVSLPLLQHMMYKCQRVLSVDSAALHLCATTTTPSLSFFGASSAACYKPLGASHVAHQGICPYNKKFTTRCPILRSCPTGACMNHPDS